MKKLCLLLTILLTLLLASFVSAEESTMITFEQPVLITSIGQSPDALMVKVLLTRNGTTYEYIPMAQVENLDGFKAIIMAVGASTKGLGAAGIDFDTELARTKALVAAAAEKNIPIILAHIGGKSRRGGKSNELIDVVMAQADYLIITSDGNEDGYFNQAAEKYNIPLKSADKISDTSVFFKEIFVK